MLSSFCIIAICKAQVFLNCASTCGQNCHNEPSLTLLPLRICGPSTEFWNGSPLLEVCDGMHFRVVSLLLIPDVGWKFCETADCNKHELHRFCYCDSASLWINGVGKVCPVRSLGPIWRQQYQVGPCGVSKRMLLTLLTKQRPWIGRHTERSMASQRSSKSWLKR